MDSKVRYLSDSEGAANASPIQQPGAYRPQTQMPPPPVNGVQGMDQQTALNNIVNFLNISQKRGTFSIEESAKIWECLKAFGVK